MNNRVLVVFFSVLLFACNGNKVHRQQADSLLTSSSIIHKGYSDDTTSSDYLIELIKSEKNLNWYWMRKFEMLDEQDFFLDSMSSFAITKDWIINDSVSAIILNNSDGTVCTFEVLLIMKNKKEITSTLSILDECDSDTGTQQDYYYTEYELIGDRVIKIFNHKISMVKNVEVDSLISRIDYIIQDNGIIKSTSTKNVN